MVHGSGLSSKEPKKKLACEAAFCAHDHSTAPLVYRSHWPTEGTGALVVDRRWHRGCQWKKAE